MKERKIESLTSEHSDELFDVFAICIIYCLQIINSSSFKIKVEYIYGIMSLLAICVNLERSSMELSLSRKCNINGISWSKSTSMH